VTEGAPAVPFESWNGFRKGAMRGSAVETIVWSSAARRTARISALIAAATPPVPDALDEGDCRVLDIAGTSREDGVRHSGLRSLTFTSM
jgi:hypothetical protein